MTKLAADLAPVRIAEDELDDRATDEREDAGCSADEREADPARVHDVAPCGLFVETAARQRSGGDQAQAERGGGDERRRGEVRVREARDAPDAELRREPQSQEIAALKRDRHGGALEEICEAPGDIPPNGRPAAKRSAPPEGNQRIRHRGRCARRETRGESEDTE